MFSGFLKLCVILMLIAVNAEYVSEFGNTQNGPPPVTEECLECLCQAKTGCKQDMKCADSMCGMFSITRPYWVDAGRPTVNETSVQIPNAPHDYPDCASDPDCAECTKDTECAVRTIRAYMKRHPQDCNEDGYINCFDYMAIHMKGGYNCVGELPTDYVNLFSQCATAVNAQRA